MEGEVENENKKERKEKIMGRRGGEGSREREGGEKRKKNRGKKKSNYTTTVSYTHLRAHET